MTKTAEWSVALSVLEPTQLVLSNIAHHLELGAKQAFVFLDKSQADLEKILATNKKVTAFVCDDRYWNKTLAVHRPEKVIFRQMRNARFAMTHCNADWLLHVDADEFLHPIGDFVQELAYLPKSFGGLWLENYERAFRAGTDSTSIFDGVFRSFPKTEPHGAPLEPFFGKNTPFSRFGFTAHNLGKSFARNDPRFAQGLHKVRLATDDSPQPMANMYCSTTARILHFDGLTKLHWVRKLLRMIAEQSADDARWRTKPRTTRELQLAMLKDRAGDSAYLIDVHDAHKTVFAEDQPILAAMGLLHTVAFDPAEAIRRQFPGTDANLSQEFFDRHLISENKHLKTLFAEIYGGRA